MFIEPDNMTNSMEDIQKGRGPHTLPKNEWSISPAGPCSGDTLDITGRAGPDEDISMQVSFTIIIPVIDGEYSYVFENIRIPGGSNSFMVRSQKVKDLSFIVRMFVDFKRSFDANNGVAEFFEKNAPSGNYEIAIKGKAYDGENKIKADFVATQLIRSDNEGKFYHKYNTTSLPAGEFTVKIGDNEKVITLRPPKTRVKKQNVIDSLIDKGALFGLGLWGLAQERIHDTAAEISGNIDNKKIEGKKLVLELSEIQMQDMEKKLSYGLDKTYDNKNIASKEDVQELKDILDRLEEKIDKISISKKRKNNS